MAHEYEGNMINEFDYKEPVMSKMKVLKNSSQRMQDILELEQLMEKKGIRIVGSHMRLMFNDKDEYRIGRDCDCFPRCIDEPFWFPCD